MQRNENSRTRKVLQENEITDDLVNFVGLVTIFLSGKPDNFFLSNVDVEAAAALVVVGVVLLWWN